VHRNLCRIARRRAELDAHEARWLREAERLKIWREFGMVSMIDYMERAPEFITEHSWELDAEA
jgi:hypothetical protein